MNRGIYYHSKIVFFETEVFESNTVQSERLFSLNFIKFSKNSEFY
jgi:hypothetical protein